MEIKVRDVIKILHAHGWIEIQGRGKGSHRFYVHPDFPKPVVLPGHLSDSLRPKTLKNLESVTGIEFIKE